MGHPTATDYYEILQLSPKADQETIERVYRLLAKRYHPDNKHTGDDHKFNLLTEAYRALSDPENGPPTMPNMNPPMPGIGPCSSKLHPPREPTKTGGSTRPSCRSSTQPAGGTLAMPRLGWCISKKCWVSRKSTWSSTSGISRKKDGSSEMKTGDLPSPPTGRMK